MTRPTSAKIKNNAQSGSDYHNRGEVIVKSITKLKFFDSMCINLSLYTQKKAPTTLLALLCVSPSKTEDLILPWIIFILWTNDEGDGIFGKNWVNATDPPWWWKPRNPFWVLSYPKSDALPQSIQKLPWAARPSVRHDELPFIGRNLQRKICHLCSLKWDVRRVLIL